LLRRMATLGWSLPKLASSMTNARRCEFIRTSRERWVAVADGGSNLQLTGARLDLLLSPRPLDRQRLDKSPARALPRQQRTNLQPNLRLLSSAHG
jgi:hypothetical protein